MAGHCVLCTAFLVGATLDVGPHPALSVLSAVVAGMAGWSLWVME